MASMISNPENVQLPPKKHVKRVVIVYPPNRQDQFLFDPSKPVYEIIATFCEDHQIPDHVNYSLKVDNGDYFVSEKNKHSIVDGQFLRLTESCLTIANRLAFDLRKNTVSLDCLKNLLDQLQCGSSREEFAYHFALQMGIQQLNQVIASKGVNTITSCALQCLVYLFKVLDCSKYGDASVIGTICSELQKNRTDIEIGSSAASYLSDSFLLLSAFLARKSDMRQSFPQNIPYVATTYLEPMCCPEIVRSALLFLNRYLEWQPKQLNNLLDSKPPMCVNLRKSLCEILPILTHSLEAAIEAAQLLCRILDKEDADNLVYLENDAAKKLNKHFHVLQLLVNRLTESSEHLQQYSKFVGYDEICPSKDQINVDMASLMTLSALEYCLTDRHDFIEDLKLFNIEREDKINLGSIAVEVVHYVVTEHFKKREFAASTIRLVFCYPNETSPESSYDTLFFKLLDLAVSTWKQMDGSKTPQNRIFSVVREQIDYIFGEPLMSLDETEFDEHVQQFSYRHLRQTWLQKQVDGLELTRKGEIGRRLADIFEPFAFELVTRQRFAVLSLGQLFTKVPRAHAPEWPCRFYKLSANGTELAYQDLEESSRNMASLSLPYSIAGSDIKSIVEGDELPQRLRPSKNFQPASCFGIHRTVPRESESESTDRDEYFFVQAPDPRTSTIWKDGLRLLIDQLCPKEKLSTDFCLEVDTIVQMEVMVRLSELPDFALIPKDLPENFFRAPDN